MSTPISEMKNLGVKTSFWLAEVGIDSAEQLRAIGSIEAYLRVKELGKPVSLNLLYAMEAGLQNRHWNSLTSDEKYTLLTILEEHIAIRQLFHGL